MRAFYHHAVMPFSYVGRIQTGHLGGPPPAPIGRKRRKHREKYTAGRDGGSFILQHDDLEKSEHGNANTCADSWNNRLRESRRRCRKRLPRKHLGKNYTTQDEERGDRHSERVIHEESIRTPCITTVHSQPSPDEQTENHGAKFSTWVSKDINEAQFSRLTEKIAEQPHHGELALLKDTPTDTSQGASLDSFSKEAEQTKLASAAEITVVMRILRGGDETGNEFGGDGPNAIPNGVSSPPANDQKKRMGLIRVSSPIWLLDASANFLSPFPYLPCESCLKLGTPVVDINFC